LAQDLTHIHLPFQLKDVLRMPAVAALPGHALQLRVRGAIEHTSLAAAWTVYLPTVSAMDRIALGNPLNGRLQQTTRKRAASEEGCHLVAGHVVQLSRDAEGCRLVQEALDRARGDDERAGLAQELRGHVWELIRSPHANHVLQKFIQVLPPQALQFIVDELVASPGAAGRTCVGQAARHRFACRVVERLVEQCPVEIARALLDRLVEDGVALCSHPYGNFVVQHMLEHAPPEHRARLNRLLRQNVHVAETQCHARAVLSRALTQAEGEELTALVRAILDRPGLLSSMARTRHGHAGVAHILRSLSGPDAAEVVLLLEAEKSVFKSTRFGRVVASRLEEASARPPDAGAGDDGPTGEASWPA